MELLGAEIDLCLWADSTPKRQIRVSDRFLRQRWDRGFSWSARALETIVHATGGQKVASGLAGTVFELPRPKKDYVELPIDVVAHLRRPSSAIAADERLLQLAATTLLYGAYERVLRAGPSRVEALLTDPIGFLVEQGCVRATAERLLESLVSLGFARRTEEGILLRTHRALTETPEALAGPQRQRPTPRTGHRRGTDGARTGRRIRSQIPPQNGLKAHSSEEPAERATKKERSTCLQYWIRPPYGVQERLGVRHVPLVSAVSAFTTDDELACWKKRRSPQIASVIADRLSAWHDAEPWRWPIVGHLLDLLTGRWLPSEDEIVTLRDDFAKHRDPGNASVRLSFFHPVFLVPPPETPSPSPLADLSVARDTSLHPEPDLASDASTSEEHAEPLEPTSPGLSEEQKELALAARLLEFARLLERPVVFATLPQRERVRQQIAWRSFERARTELEALLSSEEHQDRIHLALSKLEVSMAELSHLPSESPTLEESLTDAILPPVSPPSTASAAPSIPLRALNDTSPAGDEAQLAPADLAREPRDRPAMSDITSRRTSPTSMNHRPYRVSGWRQSRAPTCHTREQLRMLRSAQRLGRHLAFFDHAPARNHHKWGPSRGSFRDEPAKQPRAGPTKSTALTYTFACCVRLRRRHLHQLRLEGRDPLEHLQELRLGASVLVRFEPVGTSNEHTRTNKTSTRGGP